MTAAAKAVILVLALTTLTSPSISIAVPIKHLDNRDNGGGGRQHFGGSENFQRPTSSPAFQDEEKNPPFSGGFLPPRTGWKWWRYHEMSDKEILDHLLNEQHYDKREKPPSSGGKDASPLKVNVSMVIGEIAKVDSTSQVQATEGVMMQRWFDARLIHENRNRGLPYLNAMYHSIDIWMPPKISSESTIESIEVYPNGTVICISRIDVHFKCHGDVNRFPFDKVTCSAQFQSLSYTQEEIKFHWWWPGKPTSSPVPSIFNREKVEKSRLKEYIHNSANTGGEDTIIGPVLLLGKSVQDFQPSEHCASITQKMAAIGKRGNYSCLQVALEWRRDLSQYWSDLFLPDMVLVATSFLTFWLDWSSVPARAILGMGTLLSYFSNNRWSLQNLLDREENRPFEPRVNKEMTALDVWRAFSMAFIYLACAEFVLVHFLGKRASKRSKVSQLQEMLEHQHQKMQQQLERIRFEAISKASVVSTPCQNAQNKFEKTATLMRHHQRQSTNFNRQNLALLLDPYNNAGVSSASNPNYIDHQNMLGLNEATMVDHQEEPIFVPHREKVEMPRNEGARQRCCVNLSVWIDRMCRLLFPIAYFVFVICYFAEYSV